ncbi:MAG: hypothetical protein PHQ75_00935 [Thermoguttaceae bacterium]|nr:hypothetical protein [Thermoguttaceae bacterium]
MRDPFFTQETCDRCHKPLTSGRIMSKFNTDCICMKCSRKEHELPEYRQADQAELDAIKRGDLNFPGIGYPKKGK